MTAESSRCLCVGFLIFKVFNNWIGNMIRKCQLQPFICLNFSNEGSVCLYFAEQSVWTNVHLSISCVCFEEYSVYFQIRLSSDLIGFVESLALISYFTDFQFNAQEGMEGNASAATMKNVMRVFAAVSIPLTATFTKVWGALSVATKLYPLLHKHMLTNHSEYLHQHIPFCSCSKSPLPSSVDTKHCYFSYVGIKIKINTVRED